jgi:hypothetical protein
MCTLISTAGISLVCQVSLSHRAPIVSIQSAMAGAVKARVPVRLPALVSLDGMGSNVNISVCFKVLVWQQTKDLSNVIEPKTQFLILF